MKKLIPALFVLGTFSSCAQINLPNYKIPGQSQTSNGPADALQDALIKGAQSGTNSASKNGGFYRNSLIKIAVPPEARSIMQKLRSIGMNKLVTDIEKSINSAAELASKEAFPIFKKAILDIRFQDAMGIIKGGDNAATLYLKKSTSSKLEAKFLPIIKSALSKTNATKYWKEAITTYNKIPFIKEQNPDLDDYVNQQAINGLFKLIEQEEQQIRKDPKEWTTNAMKRFFSQQ